MQKQLKTGGVLTQTEERISCRFSKVRPGISTSTFNGGVGMYDGIFNQKLMHFVENEKALPFGGLRGYFQNISEKENLTYSSGLLTSAHMDCYGYGWVEDGGLIVEVIATAGVDGNAARAGELPFYRETDEGYEEVGGTINLLVFTSAFLSEGTLARTLITLTEAKSALLAHMGISSVRSHHCATGTGTDGIIVVGAQEGPQRNDVGTQSLLGYMFSEAAQTAIQASLEKECGWPQLPRYDLAHLGHFAPEGSSKLIKAMSRLTKSEREQLEQGLSLWLPIMRAYSEDAIMQDNYEEINQYLLLKYPILSQWQVFFQPRNR